VSPLAPGLPCDKQGNRTESHSMIWSRRLIILCLIAVGLAACGVRGDLDPPPGSAQKKDEPFVLDKII
jgi:predicted small lipoprotein YifL